MPISRPSWSSPGTAVLARLRDSRGLLALFAASLVLTLTGVGLRVAAGQLRDNQAAANQALIDPAATRQVLGAVSADVAKIFSYSYTDLPATERAARQVLTGSAASQYVRLVAALRVAVAQLLCLVTRVVRAGVTQLSASRAHLLVFLDQTATRGHAAVGSTPYRAQLAVVAELHGGQWRITDIGAR